MSTNKEIKKFISKQNKLDTLKFITCGSVDDGKSTLLGRLLYEAQLIFEDQVDSLVKDSKKIGTQGGDIDFALLVDGLAAEREQGITIDVAYRFFSTEQRKFIVADSPGHQEYTRNMVTAASTADLAIILIDARKGVLEQTKRHSYIANMVGIKNIIIAVNKMDLVEFSQEKFNEIIKDYQKEVLPFTAFSNVSFIPISALAGDNILTTSKNTPWYKDKPIMQLLETAKIAITEEPVFTMPVQLVLRPNLDFRGFCGTVSSGKISKGDDIFVSPSGEKATIKEIYVGGVEQTSCTSQDSVVITLNREIDVSRGNVFCSSNDYLESGDLVSSELIWFDKDIAQKNREYLIKIGTSIGNARILKIKNKIDINNFSKLQAATLSMNDIADCEIAFDTNLIFKKYKNIKDLGSYLLIDKLTNRTIAAGVINFQPRKSKNVVWEDLNVSKQDRNKLLGNDSKVLWFTGLSGSGKSTIAKKLETKLYEMSVLTYILDGDNLRHGLNRDLGFKDSDRIENLRRVGEVSKLFNDAGIFTLCCFISPFQKDRQSIRSLFQDGEFVEIYVKAGINEVQKRDPKGLYKKALEGEIPNFTGINSPYEEPKKPEIIIDTEKISADEAVEEILKYLNL